MKIVISSLIDFWSLGYGSPISRLCLRNLEAPSLRLGQTWPYLLSVYFVFRKVLQPGTLESFLRWNDE